MEFKEMNGMSPSKTMGLGIGVATAPVRSNITTEEKTALTSMPVDCKALEYIKAQKGMTTEKKIDLNTELFLEENVSMFKYLVHTDKLPTIIENYVSNIVDKFKITKDGEVTSDLKSADGANVVNITESFLIEFVKADVTYNDFVVFPKLNIETKEITFEVTNCNRMLYDSGTVTILNGDQYATYWRGEQATYLDYGIIERDPKTKEYNKVSVLEEDVELPGYLFPLVFNSHAPKVSKAVKELIINYAEVKTSLLKEVKILAANAIISPAVTSGGFNFLAKGIIDVRHPGESTQEPIKFVSQNMRVEQFDKAKELYNDDLAELFACDRTTLGLAPSSTATNREIRALAKKTNKIRKELNSLLTELIRAVSGEGYSFEFVAMPEESKTEMLENAKLMRESGGFSDRDIVKYLNADVDNEDEIDNIYLTKLIRGGAIMTEPEKARAYELGLLNPPTVPDGTNIFE